MILVDVNVLVAAHREEHAAQPQLASWLESVINADRAYGMADLVLSGFLRVVTNPRAFGLPTPLSQALDFVSSVRDQPNCVRVEAGARHWSIFRSLCLDAGATGDLVPDAYLAALAIESGSEWITMDRDFARFPGLHWRHPLDD